MKKITVILGLMILLATTVCAEEYLIPACQSILPNDYTNLIKVQDVDKDGRLDILFGTSVNGILYDYVYKGADCTVDWTARNSGGWSYDTPGDVKSFQVTDLDKDQVNEIVVNSIASTRSTSNRPTEYVYVIKAIRGNYADLWNFNKECAFTNSVYAADIDGSGKANVVMGCQNDKICVLKDDPKQKTPMLWSYLAPYQGMMVNYVKSVDIDSDGNIETVALSNKYLDGYVFALDKNGNLKWETRIDKGVHKAALPSNIIDVVDLEVDGSVETVVGTYANGVIVLDNKGIKRWDYKTQNLVSSILVTDLESDSKKEVIVGSAPNVIALDNQGSVKWTWTSGLKNGTINSMSAADVDGDGKQEVAVGTTKYLYVIDHDGKLKGKWKYVVEIQGLTKAYEERDADAAAVYMGDLDSDGEAEVLAAWNWEQGTIVGNQYSTNIRVYEINKNYNPGAETTGETGSQGTGATVTTQPKIEQTGGGNEGQPQEETTETTLKATGGTKNQICCLPMLPAILALTVAILAKIPLAARRD